MGRFENFTPIIEVDEITNAEETILEELVALANSSSGQFIRKVGGSLVNATLSETIALSGLSDVTLVSTTQGDILYHNGTEWVNLPAGLSGLFLKTQGNNANPVWDAPSALGTVTSVSVVTANGVSGTVATSTTTPAITLTLGAITPSSVTVSGLTASEIVATDASKVLQSLAVATYPSLTELTYVRGVTSAIQTQIGLKANLASPTFSGTVTIPTPLTIGAVSMTATGTELNYVVGVTSAIQTQLGLKAPLASPTFTGTVIVPTPFTIGAVSMTATGTELNYVAGVTSAIQTQIDGKSPTAGNASLVTVGTVTAGTWTGTTIAVANGGTGVTSSTGTVAVVLSTSPTLVTPLLGTPTSGVLTNCTGLPAASVLAGSFGAGAYVISTSLQAATIELGHATDTTLSRVSAGVVAIEGNNIITANIVASATVSGVVELAITSEIDTGTDSTRAIPIDQFVASNRNVRYILFRVKEKATDWDADGTTAVGGDLVIPFTGTIVDIEADVDTAGTTGTAIVDCNLNGTTIMTTNKLKWDSTEKSTRDYSGTAPGLTTTAVTAGDIITVDIDTNHSTKSKGLTLYLGIRLT